MSAASRPALLRWTALLFALVVVAVVGAWFLQSTIPRRIVLATGLPDGMYHAYAKRYAEILARDGVTVVERPTAGADENWRLLLEPAAGVDVAFLHGGVVPQAERSRLDMLFALGYEPLWVFSRQPDAPTRLDQLRHKRIAVGEPGSGVRAFSLPLLAANDVTPANATLAPLTNLEAVAALQAGQVDAALLLGPVEAPAVWKALHEPSFRLMNFERAEAYPRRFGYLTRLTLPPGTVDLALDVPPRDVDLIGTRTMLAARHDLPPAIVQVLLDAAREIHAGQGYFEAAAEFPSVSPVDLPVATDAVRFLRYGPSVLHRHLPFFVATYAERLIILLVPLLVVLVPLANVLPQLLRWRVRSRIYRWYGELKLLERDVESRRGALPVERWLGDLDRIERAATRMRIPASYASEAYTLREHIGFVRETVLAKAGADAPAPPPRGEAIIAP